MWAQPNCGTSKPANIWDLQDVVAGQTDVDNNYETLKRCIAAIPNKVASPKEIADIFVILDTEHDNLLSRASNDKPQWNWDAVCYCAPILLT